jgi:hypothetical protein
MKVASIICGVLAALGFVVATSNVFFGPKRPNANDLAEMAGYAVGSYLFPVALLIASLWLWQRSEAKKPPTGP